MKEKLIQQNLEILRTPLNLFYLCSTCLNSLFFWVAIPMAEKN